MLGVLAFLGYLSIVAVLFFALISSIEAFSDLDQDIDIQLYKYRFNLFYRFARWFGFKFSKVWRNVGAKIEIWGNKGGKDKPRYSHQTEQYLLERENRELKEKLKKLEQDYIEALTTGTKDMSTYNKPR